MSRLKITNFQDGGHGWFAVKRSLLKELDLMTKISSCSYQKGETVYLEEDCDAALFFDAYAKKQTGVSPKDNSWEGWQTISQSLFDIKKSYSDNSPVRKYPRFQIKDKPVLSVGLEVKLYGKEYIITNITGKVTVKEVTTGNSYSLRKIQLDELTVD